MGKGRGEIKEVEDKQKQEQENTFHKTRYVEYLRPNEDYEARYL